MVVAAPRPGQQLVQVALGLWSAEQRALGLRSVLLPVLGALGLRSTATLAPIHHLKAARAAAAAAAVVVAAPRPGQQLVQVALGLWSAEQRALGLRSVLLPVLGALGMRSTGTLAPIHRLVVVAAPRPGQQLAQVAPGLWSADQRALGLRSVLLPVLWALGLRSALRLP